MKQLNQSPINLKPNVAAVHPLDLELHWKLTGGKIKEGDHGKEIKFSPDKSNYASLNGKHFLLLGVHFHHPSEHFLAGHQFKAEMHIVHQNLDDLSYLVIGVFLNVNNEKSLQNANIEAFSNQQAESITAKTEVQINPQDWLPIGDTKVIRYEGSLTTPPYTETVSWAVLEEPHYLSQTIYDKIFGKTESHARALQPINRRFVIHYNWLQRN